jgi:FkbH-like protein
MKQMKIELQRLIFESRPSRQFLLSCRPPDLENRFSVQVFRNHSFEPIERLMGLYLDYAGLAIDFNYSGYDDSFSFTTLDPDCDAILIWVDAKRYADSGFAKFLSDRVTSLRTRFLGQILLACFGFDIRQVAQDNAEFSRLMIYDFSGVTNIIGENMEDSRLAAFTGTSLSVEACMYLSRDFGLKYLPALLRTPLKCIVVDLDNTLYDGVLGEDGVHGVQLTPGHTRLQNLLKDLGEQGFFLCISSKNDIVDVDALFETRTDFPLGLKDFSLVSANWNEKSIALHDIASRLNIGLDSILFIDDNIGELHMASIAHPSIKLILANSNAGITADILSNFPNLFKTNFTNEDKLRKSDLQSNEARLKLRASLSSADYLESLRTKVEFSCNNPEHTARVAELSRKTNQFIFSFARYSDAKLALAIRLANYAIVSISLSDALSDSGIIGAVVLERRDDTCTLVEAFVSCRALGRGLDKALIFGAIQAGLNHLNNWTLKVNFTRGDRNTPAENFVKEHLDCFTIRPKCFSYGLHSDFDSIKTDTIP